MGSWRSPFAGQGRPHAPPGIRVTSPEADLLSFVRRALLLAAALAAAALALGACGEKDEPTFAEPARTSGKPTNIEMPAAPGTERGRTLAAGSGCLACHRIGRSGNRGPGRDLTHIGKRLRRPAIERALVDPVAPMPSYETLPARDRREIARYLAALR